MVDSCKKTKRRLEWKSHCFVLCCLPCACVHYVKSHTHLPSCLTVLSACFTPSPLLFLFLTPKKVQWSHLAALKSSNSAAPSPPPPPVVARSQSFSESGGVASSFAQLHLRSQDPHHHHHHHHPSPARTDPQPQPPLHHPQARLEHQASSEEVPPKVRCRGTAAFPPSSHTQPSNLSSIAHFLSSTFT